jgi:nitric oxide reductase subunit C
VSFINNRAIFMTLCLAFIPYSAYVYTRGTATSHIPPMSDEARQGQVLFQEHNCVACHQFYGLGGYMGPDLTNVVSNRGSAYARAFLMSGTQRMPNFNLDDVELDALVAFLEFVDTTGRYPANEYQINWNGTVVENNE